MRKMCSIIRINIKNNLQSLALAGVYLMISIICSLVIGVIGVKAINPIIKTGKMNSEMFSYIIGVLAYSTAVIVAGINYSILFGTPFTREKVRGNIESLLASGTSVKKVWFAKSIALFIPGFIMQIIFSFGIIAFGNLFYASHGYKFILNTSLIISTYIAIPVMYFGLSLIMNIIGLLGKVADAVPISIILVAGVPAVMIRVAFKSSPNIFLILNLALAFILIVLSIVFGNKLKAERVVLSCRK